MAYCVCEKCGNPCRTKTYHTPYFVGFCPQCRQWYWGIDNRSGNEYTCCRTDEGGARRFAPHFVRQILGM